METSPDARVSSIVLLKRLKIRVIDAFPDFDAFKALRIDINHENFESFKLSLRASKASSQIKSPTKLLSFRVVLDLLLKLNFRDCIEVRFRLVPPQTQPSGHCADLRRHRAAT